MACRRLNLPQELKRLARTEKRGEIKYILKWAYGWVAYGIEQHRQSEATSAKRKRRRKATDNDEVQFLRWLYRLEDPRKE